MACVICDKPIDLDQSDHVKLGAKGCDGINAANKLRNLDVTDLVFSDNQDLLAHKQCRSKHTNPKDIKAAEKRGAPAEGDRTNLRSHVSGFNFKTHCFLCGDIIECAMAYKYPNRSSYQYSHVMTLSLQENIFAHCNARRDDWATNVQSRMSAVNDLPAEEAIYHHVCKDLFVKGKHLPGFASQKPDSSKKRKLGRPKCSSKVSAFQYATDYLEQNDDETITLNDLHQNMITRSGLPDDEVYTTAQLKRELEHHYGSRVSITTIRHLPNIVTLASNAKCLIQQAHDNATALNEHSNMDKLIQTVGEYIRTEMKSLEHHSNEYPTAQQISSVDSNINFLPHSLHLLLDTIIKSRNAKLHIASLGQSLMQATFPRAFLPPLQLGLSVTLEHKYGHRDLVEMVNRLGFCSSYTEAGKYRSNAATVQGVDVLDDISYSFLQYEADNVDHASRTLDGYGSVHVMGQMATFTPAVQTSRKVPRVKVNMEDIKKVAKVNIVSQKDPKPVLDGIIYTKLGVFSRDEKNDRLDLMWTVTFHFPKPRPLWSGCMQMVHNNIPHPGRSSDIFLPMIDLTPSDPTCVRSTLEYVSDHAARHNTTPVLTFDQQLWWIANMVIEAQQSDSPLRQIVLILGGFHTEMSFLGSIGSIMAGSGLKDVLSQVYAEGSVDQMLSGKAVARAFRSHLLVDCALNTIATAQMCSVSVPKVCEESCPNTEHHEEEHDVQHNDMVAHTMDENDNNMDSGSVWCISANKSIKSVLCSVTWDVDTFPFFTKYLG